MSHLSRRTLLGALGSAAAAASFPGAALAQSQVVRWDQQADVVVLGAGAAGLCAAIEAADRGAKALVLEALPRFGGGSARSHGVIYAGGGTALQRALGIEDSADAMFAFLAGEPGSHPEPEKLRRYCDNSAAHIDWLIGLGLSYSPVLAAGSGLPNEGQSLYFSGGELAWPIRGQPAPRGHVPAADGGAALMRVLETATRERGAELQAHSRGQRLIVNESGGVVGVQVDSAGQVRYVRARRGLILASGGFIQNRELLGVQAPELARCSVPWGGAGDRGDGLRMAAAAGGQVVRLHQGIALAELNPGRMRAGLLINRWGQRFIGEDAFAGVIGHDIAFRQGGRAFLLCDEDSLPPKQQNRYPRLGSSTSLGELAQAAGLPPGALQHTVAYYNRYAETGEDPQFRKRREHVRVLRARPYRLFDISVDQAFFPAHTLGGLRTGSGGQVLDNWGEVLTGLFAAGRCSAGIAVGPYLAEGLSLADCTFSGRQAGAAAAQSIT